MTATRWNEGSLGRVSFAPVLADHCYVYIAWGANRTRPLYIGKARKPWARFLWHMRETKWAALVEEWECHVFATEGAAEIAEVEAIHDLNPVHNVMRRKNQAYWAEVRRELVLGRRADAKRRRQIAEEMQARLTKVGKRPIKAAKPVLPEPKVKKRVRSIRWKAELFTDDQLEIIRRVQNRGRAA